MAAESELSEKKINLLVIDDEKNEVERQIEELLYYDNGKTIGKVVYLNDFPSSVEKFDINSILDINLNDDIDVVLIDYELKTDYTGTLLSAWLMLKNRNIPRIAFTARKYEGAIHDFDGFIEKKDIAYNPERALKEILDSIERCKIDKWLDNKYTEFLNIYANLCDKKFSKALSGEELQTLEIIKSILDSLDKQLDAEIEKNIDLKFKMAEKRHERLDDLNEKLDEYDNQINSILKELKNLEV